MTKRTAFARGRCASRGGCSMTFIRSRATVRLALLGALIVLAHATPAAAKVVAIPLNDYTRLGQRFEAATAFEVLEVTVPSWLDAEGGLTLTLWDSPQRKQTFARQAFTNIRDNQWIAIRLPKPTPAGTYYWEVGERTGKTRIGLWADILAAETDECIYLDGKPDRKKRFRFKITPTAFPYRDAKQMLAVIESDAPEATRIEAARQLAAMGDAEAVPRLARLLLDDERSHLARFVLQAMPSPAAAAALRNAAPAVKGALLIGVVNSLGEHRDADSVDLLRRLLGDADPQVAKAAAEALGKIATIEAADALVHRGLLDCARGLVKTGSRARAAGFCHALGAADTSPAIRVAATRGAILARGAAGTPLLLAHIRSDDVEMVRVALWIVARELPGAATTRSLAGELPKLPPEKQAMLARALCSRADTAALPELLRLAKAGRKDVRLETIRGLRHMATPAAAAALVEMLGDSDKTLADTAHNVLRRLPGSVAHSALMQAIQTSPKPVRLRAIQLVGARRAFDACPQLLDAARGKDSETRLAALKELKNLARPDSIDPLLTILLDANTPAEVQAAKRALLAASSGQSDTGALVAKLVPAVPKARPSLKQAILQALHHLGGDEARKAVHLAIDDPDPSVRDTALRLLGEWKTPESAPALLRLAATSTDARQRLLCLRAYLQVAGRPTVSAEDKLFMCRLAAPLVERADEKKRLLSTLCGLSTPSALSLATVYLDDAATRAEAAAAILAIAEKHSRGAQPAAVIQALQKVVQNGTNADLSKRAQALLGSRSR